MRRVRKVISAAGVQNASELSIDFDPSYQRLVIHDIALVRGAARVNQLDQRAVRVIEKEPESDSKIYDGTATATVTLADNRISGDIFSNNYTSATFADRNVGNSKLVTVSGISISSSIRTRERCSRCAAASSQASASF